MQQRPAGFPAGRFYAQIVLRARPVRYVPTVPRPSSARLSRGTTFVCSASVSKAFCASADRRRAQKHERGRVFARKELCIACARRAQTVDCQRQQHRHEHKVRQHPQPDHERAEALDGVKEADVAQQGEKRVVELRCQPRAEVSDREHAQQRHEHARAHAPAHGAARPPRRFRRGAAGEGRKKQHRGVGAPVLQILRGLRA